MVVRLVVLPVVFLLLASASLMLAAELPMARDGCQVKCGNITIPFPFGIGPDRICFLDDWYEITCQDDNVPRLKKLDHLEVLNISFPDSGEFETVGRITISFPITYSTTNCRGLRGGINASLEGSQFFFSATRNVFTAVGCNVYAYMNNTKSATVGCESKCAQQPQPGLGELNHTRVSRISDCSGSNGCCLTTIPSYWQAFEINDKQADGECRNSSAFLVNSSWPTPDATDLYSLRVGDHAPVVLDWYIPGDANIIGVDIIRRNDHTYDAYWCTNYSYSLGHYSPHYYCYCQYGFQGNPYLEDGCKDINECDEYSPEGIASACGKKKCLNTRGDYKCVDPNRKLKLVMIAFGGAIGSLHLLVFGRWLYDSLNERRKQTRRKQKFFKRNGGLLLQQQLASRESNIEQSRLFNSKELETATDKFHEDRILGQGGQGTVYKGMLTDGRIVAIKKSTILDDDERHVEQFINEVFILSQVNHRNVVKLLGCCLETEVPLLVYEFIPNGTLYQYLHDHDAEFLISWEVRLRIATEVAGALFYLHSAASIPIYHRDIKTTNILLDEKYRAKIADFGTSRSVALDQSHVTTLVQGTFGYLDPEYYQSSQFTDKSDVYSFGVVLVELLTGQKPISLAREHEGRSLAMFFIISMEQNCLLDILDSHVLNYRNREEIMAVAELAKRCLNFSGRNRPTMKEVALELERVRNSKHRCSTLEKEENAQPDKFGEAIEARASSFASAKSDAGFHLILAFDTQPVLPLPSATW